MIGTETEALFLFEGSKPMRDFNSRALAVIAERARAPATTAILIFIFLLL
jgi:hypothetical protein